MLKRTAFTAAFAGLLAALLLTLLQSFWVTPLILQAETYEQAAESEPAAEPAHEHEHAGQAAHEHAAEAWEPEDGWQRTLSTALSNLVVSVGFALILAGLFTLRAPSKAWQGILWGLAGFATVSLAPAAGLPPELPGTAAADLLARQTWWIGTALATAAGLALLAFARGWALRVLGLALLVVPHLIGAPHPEVPASLAPEELEQQFQIASLATNALFWAALGWLCAWIYRRGTHSEVVEL